MTEAPGASLGAFRVLRSKRVHLHGPRPYHSRYRVGYQDLGMMERDERKEVGGMAVEEPTFQPSRVQEMSGGGEPNAELEKRAGVSSVNHRRRWRRFGD
jgi:hypothetical protein